MSDDGNKTPKSPFHPSRPPGLHHPAERISAEDFDEALDTFGKKAELVSRLAEILQDRIIIKKILLVDLAEKEREALKWMLEAGGVRPWKDFVGRYGSDEEEMVNWVYHEPKSIPGRLRRSGLFFTGLLEGEQVAFIPGELRGILQELLR